MSDAPRQKMTVEENHYRFVWVLVTVVSLATGVVLFDPLQNSASLFEEYGLIILISFLFTTGIWGIYKIIQPIYTVILHIDEPVLNVTIFYGDAPVNKYSLSLDRIHIVTFQHRTPPSSNEALYDFATDYLAVYRSDDENNFQPLIDIAPEKMALKINDIADIIRFLRKYRSSIQIPEDDRSILGI